MFFRTSSFAKIAGLVTFLFYDVDQQFILVFKNIFGKYNSVFARRPQRFFETPCMGLEKS